MTPQECIAILGADVAEQVIADAAAQPAPDAELMEFLRSVFSPPATATAPAPAPSRVAA